jgi:hypothetical protein
MGIGRLAKREAPAAMPLRLMPRLAGCLPAAAVLLPLLPLLRLPGYCPGKPQKLLPGEA